MPPLPVLLAALARWLPDAAVGEECHRRGLTAAGAGDAGAARRWFAAAAACYRRDLAVEPLARLRVHELMLDAGDAAAPAAVVEVVRRLNRLDRLESLAPPHALADARTVLAQWMESRAGGAENHRDLPGEDIAPLAAA